MNKYYSYNQYKKKWERENIFILKFAFTAKLLELVYTGSFHFLPVHWIQPL